MTFQNKKTLIASSLTIIFEWYDFALYGFLAPVIAKLFFPLITMVLEEKLITRIMLDAMDVLKQYTTEEGRVEYQINVHWL